MAQGRLSDFHGPASRRFAAGGQNPGQKSSKKSNPLQCKRAINKVNRMVWLRNMIVLFMGIFTGCTSMKPIASNGPEMSVAKANELIRIHLKDGSIYQARFVSASADSIKTHSRSFAIENVRLIEKSRFDVLKTAGAVAGIYLAASAVAAIAIAAFFAPLFDGSLD